MSFPRYPRYKDSSVDWLGEVPDHWRTGRLRYVTDLIVDGTHHSPPSHPDGDYRYVTAKNIKEHGFDFSEITYVTSKEHSEIYPRCPVRKGDVLYIKDGATAGIATVNRLSEQFSMLSSVALIRPSELHLLPEFVAYHLNAGRFKNDVLNRLVGGAMTRFTLEMISRFIFVIPPVEDQAAIVAFLDRETAKIDALVAEQRRLIELLKEKRQAVISHAVTKGLNPDARMKPSGIEWLGDVPEHWSVAKMKWVARMESGHTPDKKIAAYWENCEIPWVSLNDTGYLKDNDYISDTAYKVNELGIANSSARLLPARVVVFSRDATIGRCAITTRPMAVSQHFIAWVCSELIAPEYLLYRLRSMTQELDRLTTGATLKTIGMPDVRTIVTPVPPMEEQQAIIRHIGEQSAKLDTLIVEAERAVDLLLERRNALISAAVTGKIDVRAIEQLQAAS